MKNLFSYARVNLAGSNESSNYYQLLALNKLHPIDAIKVLLEQYMLAEYLRITECRDTAVAIEQRASELLSELPTRLTGKMVYFSDFYKHGLELVNNLAARRYNDLEPVDILAFFNYNTEMQYDDTLYHGTIPEDFLYQILNFICGYKNLDIFPDGKLIGCNFYTPSIRAVTVPFKEINDISNKYRCVVELNPVPAASFDALGETGDLLQVIERYSFPEFTMYEMIGILANFGIERYRYDMTNFGHANTRPIQDVCFDIVVTGYPGSKLSQIPFNAGECGKCHDLMTFVRMVDAGKLRALYCAGGMCDQFKNFLIYFGYTPQLVNYFSNPVSKCGALESFKYDNCEIKSLFANHKYLAGLAADDSANLEDDEDTGQDTDVNKTEASNNSQEDAPNEEEETTSEDMDFTEGDDTGDTSTTNDTEPDKVDRRPEIDPKFMLLELGSPAESLSDFLYRDLVSRRISYVLKNPPENARPDVLQLLKAWKNQWLFIVSIPTIRDFLSRIALRIS